MPSGQVEPINEETRRLIRAAMKRKRVNQLKLAGLVGVDPASISRILRAQPGATISTLLGIAKALDIPPEELRVQYELAFEIDDGFAELAQRALAQELSRLRSEVGTVRAVRVTGSVGVRFHGVAEERGFERVFALQIPRTGLRKARK